MKILQKIRFLLLVASIFCFMSSGLYAQREEIRRYDKEYDVSDVEILKVRLEVDAGEVKVYPVRGDVVKISVYYTESEFRVNTDFDEERGYLDIFFDKRGWIESSDNLESEIRLELPDQVKIDLSAEIKAGEIDIELGSLAINRTDIRTIAGEVTVAFSEPNKTEMDFLRINTKIGETDLREIGNARFKDAEINGGIGEMHLDLSGDMLAEAYLDVDLDIGETDLELPHDSGVKMSVSKFLFLSQVDLPHDFKKSGRYYYSRNFDRARNSLNLRVSAGLGELRIR